MRSTHRALAQFRCWEGCVQKCYCFASINARIDEVEEEKTLDAIGRHPRKRLNDRTADIVSNKADAVKFESVEKGQYVIRLVIRAKSAA